VTRPPLARTLAAGAVAALLVAVSPAAAQAAADDPGTDRWWGADRYGTAAAVSDNAFPDPPVDVVVVNGSSYADALAAAPLAASLGGPVLTVSATAIPAETLAELQQIGPGVIWVVGGPAAVSDGVVAQLKGYAAWSVHRLAGADRYATAARVATKEFTGQTHEVFIASGERYADALSAGAAAAHDGAPLLLTAGGSLPDATLAALRALDPERVVVVGGRASVTTGVTDRLEQRWPGEVTRIAGADRYETAAEVAETVDRTGDEVVLAGGEDYPDALAGAALGLPLLLSRTACLPAVTAAAYTALGTTWVDGLGGSDVLSDAALGGTPC
jgi:putative cell wall-binding protein